MSGSRKNNPNRNPNPNEGINKKVELIKVLAKQFESKERKDLVNEDDKPSLVGNVAPDILRHIGSYLDPKSASHYAQACETTHHFFQPDLNKLAVKKFLQHVAYGEKDEAEKMLKSNPALLLAQGTVTNEAGSTLKDRTAYQIALMEKDVSPYPEEFSEMAEMIEGYLVANYGEAEKIKQHNEQFPEGYEKEEEERKQRDNKAVEKMFDAIDKAQSDEEAEQAVEEFKQYLEKENKREFTTGNRFNEGIFTRALELYDHYYNKFGGFNSKKNNLVAVKGFGGIEGYFPANVAQAMCDGVGNVVEKKQQLTRCKLLDDKKTSFFDSRLGVSHFVYSYYAGACGRPVGPDLRFYCVASMWRVAFQNLCQAKTTTLSSCEVSLLRENQGKIHQFV